jgi:hypothetical protein
VCACLWGGVADPPYTVLKVTELMDANGILQGQPGYSNPIVCEGDVMYAINGERIGNTANGPGPGRSKRTAAEVTACCYMSVYACCVSACLVQTIHTGRQHP